MRMVRQSSTRRVPSPQQKTAPKPAGGERSMSARCWQETVWRENCGARPAGDEFDAEACGRHAA